MKVRLRQERGPRRRASVARPRPTGAAAVFPKADVARMAREAIMGIEREEEEKEVTPEDGDDGWLYLDPEDRFTPVDRVFSRVQSSLHFSLRLLACTLTVVAGCELAYTFDLVAFNGGRNGAILAAVVACFAAARWITKD